MSVDLPERGAVSGQDAEHADAMCRAVADISSRLLARFGETVPRLVVEEIVRSSYARIAVDARITAFLPVLAEHAAAERLMSIAQSDEESSEHLEPEPPAAHQANLEASEVGDG